MVDLEEDLFGPRNEEYQRTPASSPLPPPNFSSPLRHPGNHSLRGNYGYSIWNVDKSFGGSSVPLKFQTGQNRGTQINERFVAELKLSHDEETLCHSCPPFQEPTEIACYSRSADGNVHYDDRCLRCFRYGVLEETGTDLNIGFEMFVEKREDTESSGFGDLLSCLRDTNIPLSNIHFVILGTVYNRSEAWEMGVHKRLGTVYLDVHKLPEGHQSERQRRMCYWGYSFEQLATDDCIHKANEVDCVVDANVEYCALIKTKLGAHRIIMGAEIDCYDISRDGKRRYIELKTCREIDSRTVNRFEKEKLLKFWIQSFLAGIPKIVCGFRDDDGKITRVEVMGTKEITQRVKQKNFWQGGVCLAFADRVLCWLYGTVKEDKDYVLRFVPGTNHLELLHLDCCPAVIDKHLELLI
eukprot:c26609_g1_i1 orf=458-1690(-)